MSTSRGLHLVKLARANDQSRGSRTKSGESSRGSRKFEEKTREGLHRGASVSSSSQAPSLSRAAKTLSSLRSKSEKNVEIRHRHGFHPQHKLHRPSGENTLQAVTKTENRTTDPVKEHEGDAIVARTNKRVRRQLDFHGVTATSSPAKRLKDEEADCRTALSTNSVDKALKKGLRKGVDKTKQSYLGNMKLSLQNNVTKASTAGDVLEDLLGPELSGVGETSHHFAQKLDDILDGIVQDSGGGAFASPLSGSPLRPLDTAEQEAGKVERLLRIVCSKCKSSPIDFLFCASRYFTLDSALYCTEECARTAMLPGTIIYKHDRFVVEGNVGIIVDAAES